MKMVWDDYYKAKMGIWAVLIGVIGFDLLAFFTASLIAAVCIVCFELIIGGFFWVAILMDKNGWDLEDIF